MAESQDEVFNYLKELITENGVHRIVKSKSMATEELHLNDVLEQFGVDEVVETDLGEWILQIKKDKPSHMVLPSIHLTRSDVADVLNQQLPYTVKDDVNDIVSVARKELRKKFIDAEMGINGANVLIAESGSYVLFTNEGNGRLTANLPPIQVVIAGIEKLVPKFTDLLPIITALPKSATAQKNDKLCNSCVRTTTITEQYKGFTLYTTGWGKKKNIGRSAFQERVLLFKVCFMSQRLPSISTGWRSCLRGAYLYWSHRYDTYISLIWVG
ncbi:hypothetical protein SSCH_800012 [Syntrophaceticus schinkii]|uniref:LUD domain-containing protein n=1 Tax=Syntrophaceticus schinkii TaxID=499207 RepID=A0A0B7MQQ8_9FIRM|nr:hypothetical protein SSCH_800012 [Syntrophaceticus schinkii]